MKKKLAIVLLALAVAVAFAPASAYAVTKVKMTSYQDVLKAGNTVYVAGPGRGIYEVKVKNDVMKSKKWLVKTPASLWEGSQITGMKIKGNYLYYCELTDGTPLEVCRVNLKTKDQMDLAFLPFYGEYAIKGKKLYVSYKEEVGPDYKLKTKRKVMKLNGKSKKSTSVKVVTKFKKSNAKGYSVIYKEKNGYVKTYLKTPKGKYYLGKVELLE